MDNNQDLTKIKESLQRTRDLQRKKSELYVKYVQKANKLKAESYSLHLRVADYEDQLMRA
jgi:cell division protein FtsB